jgi:LytS/YehU family sensor histidine kinase
MGIPTGYLSCSSCRTDLDKLISISIYSAILWVVLWKGNEFVSLSLDKKWDWIKSPVKRLIAGVTGHVIFTIVAIFLINYTIFSYLGWEQELRGFKNTVRMSIAPVLITIIVATSLTARDFFLSWRQGAVNQEKMKKELAIAKYEALKNQVNPHFLFNSLNVLTSLIYKDADLSAQFIKNLSEVYRYVLEVKDLQLVNLDQEVRFLKSFEFLLKMRHQDGLNIHIDLPELKNYMVVPLALQMLVENAVKHNAISLEEPLNISVFSEGNFIVVENNLQKKPAKTDLSPKIGLSNIKARYAFLSDVGIIVNKTTDTFEVKLPLISINE